ncbi:hypothetical protein [Clostridium tyrobutyricum]|uniref:hypothetical protein n=1 Tax=Clostridium tyrobutyricum TaxID=1519 RepID=UPI00073DA00C|nr:hypothetical protein [Clostridium tyrobutyricum]
MKKYNNKEIEKVIKVFKEVAIELSSDLSNTSFDLCEDNYVGTLYVNKNNTTSELWFCKHLRNINSSKIILTDEAIKLIKSTGDKIIVIVLESPHIDEFNKTKCSIAPAPALGITGCNLDKYFEEKIQGYLPDGKYHIILTNAIQYQCSLGTETDVFRDRMWLKLWICKEFNKNFIGRLEKYNPDIIINLCTKGSHKKDVLAPPGTKTVINKEYLENVCGNEETVNNNYKKTTLNEITQESINEYSKNKKIICIKGTHPSSWYSEKNIRISKV